MSCVNKSHRCVITLILAYTSPPFVVAFWIHCTLVHFLGHATRFHSNRCYDNQNKCVFWKPSIKFVLVVSWNCASILRRFPVIYGYPLQWDFGRSICPRWTNVLASISHTDVSLRSLCRTPQFVVAFWIHCTLVHFLGHVTRFHGNCCYGSQEICVFWKGKPNFIIAVYWKMSSTSHRFRVICDYSLLWDFL